MTAREKYKELFGTYAMPDRWRGHWYTSFICRFSGWPWGRHYWSNIDWFKDGSGYYPDEPKLCFWCGKGR